MGSNSPSAIYLGIYKLGQVYNLSEPQVFIYKMGMRTVLSSQGDCEDPVG